MQISITKLSGLMLFILSVSLSVSDSFARTRESGLTDPIQKGEITIDLETVATGLTAPNWGTYAPGDDGRLFVADQDGDLWAIDLNTGVKTVFLDVSDRLVALGISGPGTFDERGLLGVALHPDYSSNGLLYTYTSELVNGPADFSTMPAGSTANHQSVITEWEVPEPNNTTSVVDPLSARELLRIDEPQFNHDGGALNFGSDEMLYISVGDGGNADDQGNGHGIIGNGQDPSNILGAILRINPAGSNATNGQYGIPSDNPFVGMNDIAEEIFAYGFRNPFRFSFDMVTGDLYVGDVGQNDIEEIDVVVAGGNYGWNLQEGSFCFDANGTKPGFAFVEDPCPGEPAGLIDPVAEYNTADDLINNDDGRAIVGGFVYRGTRIPALAGRYVFGDFSRFTESGINNDGRLFYFEEKNTVGENKIQESKILEFQLFDQDDIGLAVLGFGQDANGELYVLANETGTPFGDTGVVLRIAPVTVNLKPNKDNTLYESADGLLSNGAGQYFFVGKTLNGAIRRGVISFDISGNVPAGSTITNVSLTLHMSKTSSGAYSIMLHKLLTGWGEGSSDASGNEGSGAAATSDDVTWLHTIYNERLWANPGGDFSPTPRATTMVDSPGSFTWGSTTQMVADVQAWLDTPGSNFGWLLLGDETANQTSKRFDTRENTIAGNQPMLVIEFVPPSSSSCKMYIPMVRR